MVRTAFTLCVCVSTGFGGQTTRGPGRQEPLQDGGGPTPGRSERETPPMRHPRTGAFNAVICCNANVFGASDISARTFGLPRIL